MSVNLTPYLNFHAQAKEAMEFYQSIFGGELTSTTFAEAGGGGMGVPDDEQHLVMHSQLDVPGGITLMGADVPSHMGYEKPAGFTVSLSGTDEATLKGYWERLSEGATPGVPLEKAPWGDQFGMLTDKFGVPWLVNITAEENAG